MAKENFLTYTEVDPTTKITVTAEKITFAAITNNDNSYVYKDKGAGYFDGDFQVVVKGKITASTDNGRPYIWGLANVINDFGTIYSDNGTFLGVQLRDATVPDPYIITIGDCLNGSLQESVVAISTNTDYWIKK